MFIVIMNNITNRAIYQIVQLRAHYSTLAFSKFQNIIGHVCSQKTHLPYTKCETFHKDSKRLLWNFNKMKEEIDLKKFQAHYEDIVEAQKDEETLIVDVREKSEIEETGKLPGSIHIPMGDAIIMLQTAPDVFTEKYNRQWPYKYTKIILSCRSGKRSEIVQKKLIEDGFTNVYNYAGGWLDWESKTKK